MALIGKLRDRMGFILAIAIGFSLFAFVLGDILTSGTSLFESGKNDIGQVAGESISALDFERKYQENAEFWKINNQKDNLDEQASDNVREQTWNQIITEMIMGKAYVELGITVSTEELWDMVQGKFLHPKIKEVQFFHDSLTGLFKPDAVVGYLNNIKDDPKSMNQWVAFESGIKKERIAQKYNNLVKLGTYTTKAEAILNKKHAEKTARAKYFKIDYASIVDSTIVVSDKELKTYFNQHQDDYKNEDALRSIEYVAFAVSPSQEDYSFSEQSTFSIIEEFKAAKNDSEFVMRNSDNRLFSDSYVSEKALPAIIAADVMNSTEGNVIGPYLDQQSYKLTKVIGFKNLPDSVKARHILLSIEGSPEATLATADSLKKLIKSGKAKFADLAATLSKDPGSGSKGGDLGWFSDGMMVKPFNDACFNGKKGDLPIVTSQFGVHLIEIMDLGVASKKVMIATVEKLVETSTKTDQQVYAKASEFASKYNSADLFAKGVADEKLTKRLADNIKESDKTITGLESPRELIRWAYKSEKGDVSKVLQFGKTYVVAILDKVNDKGTRPFENVKEEVMAEVRKEKKAQMLIEKIKTSSSGAANIEDLATKLGVPLESTEEVNFANAYLGKGAGEPSVVGILFASKAGVMSEPIKGNVAVYVIQPTEFKEPIIPTDLSETILTNNNSLKQKADYQLLTTLKEKAAIQDYRSKFY